ncbi:outer membrane beta-barrel protein [Erythrobacter sp. R86502]|uniref:outer membrane beta-barrel protein n=1 Tax=Erythrobacter sp. R86502 TaxID=3093846 RepID=UPI0036D36AF6
MTRKSPGRRVLFALLLGATCLCPTSLLAQTTVAPLLAADDPVFRIDPITAGPLALRPQITAVVSYDDNVLASPEGTEINDVEFVVRPELAARIGDDNLAFQMNGYGEFSRFADFSSENSDIYGVNGLLAFSPRVGDRLNVFGGFARLKENRGDPEARLIAGPGPRLIDETSAGVNYRRSESRVQFSLEANYSDLDAVSSLDDDRDFEVYAGRATVGYRISGPISVTATGFVNVRDFRQEATLVDPDRDAVTFGGQVGVGIAESERLRGRLRLGVFRFEPEDKTIAARNGFSADVSLAYLPTRRLAFILEAFNGDVATFRRGAEARTDSRVSFVTQVEMRHNFFGRVGARWVRSEFVGSGVTEDITGANVALEYLANRRFSLIAEGNVSQRTSDDPLQEFERFRLSLSARIRF